MIDNFALALSHGLLILAAWRLLSRPDLDDDSIAPPAAGAIRRAFVTGKASLTGRKRPGA